MLNAQSVTRPDDLGGTEIISGAIDIMGPDYPRQWCSVDVDATDTLNAQWQTFQYVLPTAPFVNALNAGAAASASPVHVAQLWVTPTDTEFFISANSSAAKPPNWNRIYYGAINEDGILDIDVSARASLAGTNTIMNRACVYEYCANFIHIFAYVDQFGYVRYNMASEFQKQQITSYQSYSQLSFFNNGAAGPAVITAATQVANQPAIIFKSRPRMQRNGMSVTTGGKYIGTAVTLSLLFNSQETNADAYTVYCYDGSVRVRARNVDSPGRVGPAHIIRYDGLSVGQQMSFAGTTWIQGIALGQLAPFINTNGTTLTVPDSIFSKFAELLWAVSPKYRRIMTLKEYNQTIKPYFRDLTVADLMQSIERMDAQTASVARSLGAAGGFIPALRRYYDEAAGALRGAEHAAYDYYDRHRDDIHTAAKMAAGLGALGVGAYGLKKGISLK
jgi:hypothetical protein